MGDSQDWRVLSPVIYYVSKQMLVGPMIPSACAFQEALQESAAVRADLEGRLRMGLRTGDAEMHPGLQTECWGRR